MKCRNECPRGLKCEPISNVVADDNNSFVCMGYHNEKKRFNKDKFRHCFKSITTDSIFDYDEYDILSVINVMSDALLIEHLENSEDE